MGFNCGIVGLPNVGKSTLFNALTETAAASAANYPFCTIEPNIGRVPVPDARLEVVARIARSAKIVPTQLEIKDIAGLVRGASKGEGLGNRFLGAIREVDAVLHVLRCFEDPDVTHVEGGVDPLRDAELVETELLLSDLESLERQKEALIKRARGQDKEAKARLELLDRVLPPLGDGCPARRPDARRGGPRPSRRLSTAERQARPLCLQCRGGGRGLGERAVPSGGRDGGGAGGEARRRLGGDRGRGRYLAPDERKEYLETLGLVEPGLNRVIGEGYALLDLLTFLTVGPKEARAWTTHRGATAPEGAGAIHTDFQKGFICAEVIAYDDFVALGGEQGAKEAGKMRLEGRDYVIQDGDVCHFRFNV